MIAEDKGGQTSSYDQQAEQNQAQFNRICSPAAQNSSTHQVNAPNDWFEPMQPAIEVNIGHHVDQHMDMYSINAEEKMEVSCSVRSMHQPAHSYIQMVFTAR